MKKTILCIDDSNIIKSVLKSILAKKYELLFASNGQEAIDISNKFKENNQKINLFMVDINMPVMSGEEFIEKIKKESFFKFTPVIILSGSDDIINKNIRFNSRLQKPFDKEVLIKTVDKILNPLNHMKEKYGKLA